DRGPDETGVLQLCLHHLVCDGLSVSICVSSLLRAYRRCLRGEPPEPPAGVPFGEWACALDDLAQTEEVRRDLTHWQQTCRALPPVWRDSTTPSGTDAAPWSAGPRAELEPAAQRRFLARFPTARAQHEALLAAFARAWQQHTGQDELFVRLEQHGRQPLGG